MYRIKINNVEFQNNNIAKGSFNITREPRIAKSYTDINGISHEINYPTNKTIISFSIREHSSAEHSTLASFFNSGDDATVSYWDDNSSVYREGTFKIEPIKWNHLTIEGDNIQYAAAQVKLEER